MEGRSQSDEPALPDAAIVAADDAVCFDVGESIFERGNDVGAALWSEYVWEEVFESFF